MSVLVITFFKLKNKLHVKIVSIKGTKRTFRVKTQLGESPFVYILVFLETFSMVFSPEPFFS